MRPNLSFDHLVTALAALGTSALIGCGGSQPAPVSATDVAPSTTPGVAGQKSCSANGCGGSAKAAAPATSAASDTPATAPAAAATPAPTDTSAATAPPATTSSATAAATAPTPKKAAPKAVKKGGAGAASCGVGTCGSSPK